ncbi:hypothetical protein ATCV1_z340R [Acanthocystis turfacea chlorella virus 1]|uniref:Uncharacterized protein z340R n=1 Tax=Chlorovirus heliozoae TaxID=322019 RepID=A7K8V0_9PHYC|nr:hypothetical protein ATCV1_z340R [Acanthocystis turfacea chlorella virus 1]ABT16474.1 hypothetical protein ATCV1_z340R [Acanthocystis turfacea chlorella virus 1]
MSHADFFEFLGRQFCSAKEFLYLVRCLAFHGLRDGFACTIYKLRNVEIICCICNLEQHVHARVIKVRFE